jgi:hypothetical protein
MPKGRLRRVRLGACSVTVAVLLAGGSAGANGRFPAAQFVTLTPDAQGRRIALRTTFGIAVSDDAGRTWRWLCEELFEYGASGPPWDPRLAWARGPDATSLLVGLSDGLTRSSDFCASARVPEAARDFTGDVTVAPDGVVLWVSSNGSGANRVLASRDGGATFEARGTLPEGFLPETLEATGADGARVYVSGVTIEPRRPALYRSDDGGRNFSELPFDALGGRDAFISGVVASRPDVVFVRSSLPEEPDGGVSGTLLLRSVDGGRSFREVARTAGPMFGFALSDDGARVWVGGSDPRDALRRSVDGGDSFTTVSSVRALCLRWHPSGLYACAPYVTSPFALGRSTDEGSTFSPLLRFESLVGPPACAPGTRGAGLCTPRWPVVRAMFQPLDAGAADAGGPMDGAVVTPPSTPPDGCGCRAERVRERRGWGALWVALAALISWRRRASGRGSR